MVLGTLHFQDSILLALELIFEQAYVLELFCARFLQCLYLILEIAHLDAQIAVLNI